MAKIILCETQMAKEPFVFSNTRVEVFSYEELCYYIYNNQILVTMDSIDGTLLSWLRTQVALPQLAQELTELMEKESPLEDYLIKILMHKNFYSVDEIREFMSQYDSVRLLRPFEREKLIADGYLRYRRYTKAISIYRQLLEEESTISDQHFLGNVYHNLGMALANNLQLSEASFCFLKAFTMNENELSLRSCFLVMASYESENTVRLEMKKYHLPDTYFEAVMDEVKGAKEDLDNLQLYHRMQKAVYNREHGDYKSYVKRMDNVLQEMKETYREQTI